MQRSQRAGFAFGHFPAEGFPRVHDEGVKLVEEGGIVWEVVHEHLLDTVVVCIIVDQAVALEDPSGVSVADEDGFPAGIQKDAVGRLLSDALHTEEFIPEGRQLLG